MTSITDRARARPWTEWGRTLRIMTRTGLRNAGMMASLVTLASRADGNAKWASNAT